MFKDFPNLPKPRCNNSFSPEQKQKITKKKMQNKKQKHTSQNGNTRPEKRSINPDTPQHFLKKKHTKRNLQWKHNIENKIRDTKQKQQPENDM